eukprot:COSAG06_NODE_8075_length_2281_cov_1.541247_1_plen_121_part_00
MRAQNNNHNKKETINTMTTMSRPQSPAAAEPGEEDPAQQPQPIALEYEDAAALIAALSPLAEEPLAAGGATLDAGEGKKWSSAQGSVSLFVSLLSVCLSVYLLACLLACLPVCLSVCLTA